MNVYNTIAMSILFCFNHYKQYFTISKFVTSRFADIWKIFESIRLVSATSSFVFNMVWKMLFVHPCKRLCVTNLSWQTHCVRCAFTIKPVKNCNATRRGRCSNFKLRVSSSLLTSIVLQLDRTMLRTASARRIDTKRVCVTWNYGMWHPLRVHVRSMNHKLPNQRAALRRLTPQRRSATAGSITCTLPSFFFLFVTSPQSTGT